MYRKLHKSGLTEIIPFTCISAIWGQYSVIFHILSSSVLTIRSGFSLASAGSQVLFSFLGAFRTHRFIFGWLESLMTVASLFTDTADGKESACNAGDLSSVPGLGRSFGEGNGNPLQYSCLENSMDRGAWQATVHGVTKSQT